MKSATLLVLAMLSLSVPAAAASISDKKPRAVLTSDKAQDDLAACLAERLEWFAPASSVVARDGAKRLQFSSWGRIFTDILISGTNPAQVEVRGVYTGKVKRKIGECL